MKSAARLRVGGVEHTLSLVTPLSYLPPLTLGSRVRRVEHLLRKAHRLKAGHHTDPDLPSILRIASASSIRFREVRRVT